MLGRRHWDWTECNRVEFMIILLAMVAAFLGLRLYSVLGKRTGHEQELPRRMEEPRSIPDDAPSGAVALLVFITVTLGFYGAFMAAWAFLAWENQRED